MSDKTMRFLSGTLYYKGEKVELVTGNTLTDGEPRYGKGEEDMKRTIWKYDLEVTDEQTIQIPQGASILTVDTQDGLPKLWLAVCPEEKKLPVRVAVVGTGNPLWCDGWIYAGSFKMRQDILVFHVFVEPVEL